MNSSSLVEDKRVGGKREYASLLDELLRSGGIDSPKKITVTAELVRFVGCNAALMLNQILYWSVRGNKTKGFFKSDRDWSKELGLKRSAIISARSRLEAMQIVKTTVKQTPRGTPTNHYKLDFEELKRLFSLFLTLPARNWEQILKSYKPIETKKQTGVVQSSVA